MLIPKPIYNSFVGVNFTYGYDGQRMRMTSADTVTNRTRTKEYVGGCEFVNDNGSTRVYTYVIGPNGVFAAVIRTGGVDRLYYIYKDHLGSWTTVTDSVGNVAERRSFDAWGNIRSRSAGGNQVQKALIVDRGFTGHEHLFDFGLINMNGRMYDPMMSAFLSPDNYMQDPTSQQGFNRYAYCMYNPLKYVDPTGEQYFGWNGCSSYYDEQAFRALMRMRFNNYLEIIESTNERINFYSNSLWSQGDSNGGSFLGVHSKGGSGNHGSGGDGVKIGSEAFKKLCEKHGIEPGKPIPKDKQTDAFLKEFQQTFFPNMPMNYITELSINGYPFETDEHGVTQTDYDIFYGKARVNGYSCIYLNPDYVFQCPENLFYTMGHEFVHASQNIALIDCMYNHIVNDMCIEDIKEYNAYSWDESMGFKHLPFEWSTNCDNYKSYKKILDYKSFSWLNNLIHP